MAPHVQQINVKPDIQGEVGLPKLPINIANVTFSGIDYGSIEPGQQYKIGDVTLEISFICDPCSNLYALPYVGEDRGPEFIKTLMNRRGWYARVLTPGTMKPGDGVALLQ